jgi:tRNA A-37 threonylcarbamoyl transferase component Bud32
MWLAVAGFIVLMLVAVSQLGVQITKLDNAILGWLEERRTAGATRVARTLQQLGSPEAVAVLRWVPLLVALGFRRFRHVFVFLGCILVSTWFASTLSLAVLRDRPFGAPIIGEWEGFSYPSRPLVDVSVALIGIIYLLLPRGPLRSVGKWMAGGYVGLVLLVHLYLAVDNPSDAAFGVVWGTAIAVIGFRMLVPDEVFPVRYGGRGRAAHLDVGGRRGEAIRQALSDQLCLDVAEVEPFGLDGSAGSTPLRITLADGSPPLFGKLYAQTHLRADRSYKLFRTLLYGRLEDESTFSTVRRLIQYEDYVMRLARDAGLPTAKPYGFVEITPQREYLLVTEFFGGATEIGDAEVDEALIDDGLRVVRQLWDAGLAHRDIKPANLLVRDGRVMLIDLAFAEARPSPWREAVDLANMMLVLALRSDARTVYERAVLTFTPEEIGEAFAATRGLTLTSQLRASMRQDGRDLLGEFCQLAPHHTPIRIQRWSVRRVVLTLAVLLAGILGFAMTLNLLSGSQLL